MDGKEKCSVRNHSARLALTYSHIGVFQVMTFSVLSLSALLGVGLLALFPDPRMIPPEKFGPDKITLLFLILAFALANIPKLREKAIENRDFVPFLTLCASVILFHLADRGPHSDSIQIAFGFAKDESVVVSYAACLAILGAILGTPAWWKSDGKYEKYFVAGTLLLGIFGYAALKFLGGYYDIGLDKTLDAAPTATLLVQVVSYAALALCVRAATATEMLRGLVLRVFPAVLLVVWARHQFAPIPAPVEEDE